MDDNSPDHSLHAAIGPDPLPPEVIDDLPILVSFVDPTLVYRFVNRAYEDWLGVSRGSLIGRPVREIIGESGFAAAEPNMRRALAGECVDFETMAPYRGGDMRHLKAIYRPHFTDGGQVSGFHAIVEDMTPKRRAEEILSAALDGMADGYLTLDRSWRIQHFNTAAERIYGRSRKQVLGKHVDEVWQGASESVTADYVRAAMSTGTPQRGEVDGTGPLERSFQLFVLPLSDGGVGMVFEDITERKEAERHRELLISELNHRVKNTLAIVQAITRQSLSGSEIDRRIRDTLEGRIMALAAAHDALTRGNWETVALGELVANALQAFSRDGRISIDGPEVGLQAKSAVAVSLAVHELATNAVKYGALSAPGGRVAVRWSVCDAGFLLLRWIESGGPPVTSPAHKGFGSRLIAALAHDLGGELKVDYAPNGVICEILAKLPKQS